eukprot:7390395-Prymnesium_polylepis.2
MGMADRQTTRHIPTSLPTSRSLSVSRAGCRPRPRRWRPRALVRGRTSDVTEQLLHISVNRQHSYVIGSYLPFVVFF